MIPGIVTLGIAALISAHLFTTPAFGASCKQLSRQLASLNSSNSRGGSSKYRRAAKKQQKYIHQVRRQMRANNCVGRKNLFGRLQSSTCRKLTQSLGDMEARLRTLRRKAAGPKVSASARRRIKRSMKKKGCGLQEVRKKKTNGSSAIKQVYGNLPVKKQGRQQASFQETLESLNRQQRNGGYGSDRRSDSVRAGIRVSGKVKTICVRTCDGYFFPVGFSTVKGERVPGADACSNSCPGTKMALYYRKANTENPKYMYSVDTGKPYTALPTAFAYRKRFNPNCRCNFRLLDRTKPNFIGGLAEIAGAERKSRSATSPPVPTWRVDRGQDPETVANIGGGWNDLRSIDPVSGKKTTKVESKPKKKRPIRTIGEPFFPGQ